MTTARGQRTPAPWVNVLANPQLRHGGLRERPAYTWGENAHEFRLTPWNNDPVTRRQRRGVLPPRRGARPVLVADALALPGATAVRHPARLRLQRLRTRRARHPLRAVDLRGGGRAGQVHGPQDPQRRPAGPSPLGHRLRGMGPGRTAAAHGHARGHRARPADRRPAGAQPLQQEFATARRSSPSARPRARSPATGPSSSGATARCQSPAAMARTRLSGKVGAALDPCGAIRVAFELAAGQEREIVFMLGVGRDAEQASDLVRRLRGSAAARLRPRRGLALLDAHARRGARGDARSGPQRPGQRLAALSDPGLPPLGPERDSTSRAAPSASAISCRMPWPWSTPGPTCCASTCSGARRASSARATCSTGGTRRRAAACGPAARTTTSGCPWRSAATSAPPATPACSTRRCRSWQGRPVNDGRRLLLRPAPHRRRERAASTSTACGPSPTACASARTACRSWAPATGTTA